MNSFYPRINLFNNLLLTILKICIFIKVHQIIWPLLSIIMNKLRKFAYSRFIIEFGVCGYFRRLIR